MLKRKISLETLLYAVLLAFAAVYLTFIIPGSRSSETVGESAAALTISGECLCSECEGPVPLENGRLGRHVHGSSVLIRGSFLRPVDKGLPVQMYISQMDVSLSINGQELFSLSDNERYEDSDTPFGAQWYSFVSPGIDTEDVVELRLVSHDNGSRHECFNALLENLFACSKPALLAQKLRDNAPQIVIGLLILLLGTGFSVAVVILTGIKQRVKYSFLSLGLLQVFGGLCSVIDYDYITLLIPNVLAVNAVDYVTQVMVCICLLRYLRAFLISRLLKAHGSYVVCGFSVAASVCFLLQLTGVLPLGTLLTFGLPFGALMLTVMLGMLLADFRRCKSRRLRLLLYSVFCLGVFTAAEITHFYYSGSYWIVVFQLGLLCFTFTQYYVFMLEMRGSMEKARRFDIMEAELAKSRIAVLLSQLQPHFLFNALVVIRQLCEQDPKMAQVATEEFATYLRGNVDALTLTRCVPFSQEMTHVTNYLSLEQKRFDDIFVVYDIQADGFMLPPLTVQPMVENAVRHGISKSENGGTVTISSREEAERFVVIISDDGVGFDAEALKQEGTNCGIANTRARLAAMCQGTLSVTSMPGYGTTVFITVPKNRDKPDSHRRKPL